MRERLKSLSTGVAIYGAGDAAMQVVNFALLAVYVQGGFLRDVDYGALATIGALEAFWKVLSRWGLDGAFMRHFHERGDGLPRFASSIVWFMLAADTVLLVVLMAAARMLAPDLFGTDAYTTALQLMVVNTFLIAFTFVPFHAMRMRQQAVRYSALVFARSAATVVLRIVLVIGMGLGLTGIYLADIVVTLILAPLLWSSLKPYLVRQFSWPDLRVALRFGLPRVPHGLAQQALEGGNKLMFSRFSTLSQLGVYQNGVTLGTGIRFFTSAFETGWAPFYYATAREPDARIVLGKMATYGLAVLALLVAVTTVVARDVILLVLTPAYLPAVPILPLVALGIASQGTYLLTSIGLNLSGRTEYYSVATFSAVAVGLGTGAFLMPTYGALGAAWAFLLSYLTQAVVAFLLARSVYRIDFEAGRLARVAMAGVMSVGLTMFASRQGPDLGPLAGLVVRATLATAIYGGVLWTSGFLRASERAFVQDVWRRRARRASASPRRGPSGER